MDPFKNVAEVLQHIEKKHWDNPTAFNYKVNGEWQNYSTKAYLREIKDLSLGLVSMGLKKGDKVGIMAPSSSRWSIADLAIMMAGGGLSSSFFQYIRRKFSF